MSHRRDIHWRITNGPSRRRSSRSMSSSCVPIARTCRRDRSLESTRQETGDSLILVQSLHSCGLVWVGVTAADLCLRPCTTPASSGQRKLKRFVALPAARTDELEHLVAEGRICEREAASPSTSRPAHRCIRATRCCSRLWNSYATGRGCRARARHARTSHGCRSARLACTQSQDRGWISCPSPWSACGHVACDSAVMSTLSRGLLAGIRSFGLRESTKTPPTSSVSRTPMSSL